MAANRFFSPVVRIQAERGHHLVTAGPYALPAAPRLHGADRRLAVRRRGAGLVVVAGAAGPLRRDVPLAHGDGGPLPARGAGGLRRLRPSGCGIGWCRACGEGAALAGGRPRGPFDLRDVAAGRRGRDPDAGERQAGDDRPADPTEITEGSMVKSVQQLVPIPRGSGEGGKGN